MEKKKKENISLRISARRDHVMSSFGDMIHVSLVIQGYLISNNSRLFFKQGHSGTTFILCHSIPVT